MTDSVAHWEAFERANTYSNIKRILIIGSLYTLFEIIGLILSTMGYFESDIRLYVSIVVGFHLIFMPILFIVYHRRDTYQLRLLNVLSKIYFPIVIIWGSLFTVLIYLVHEDITIYTVIVLLYSGIFIVKPNYTRILFGVGWLFITLLFYTRAESVNIANALTFKSLIVTGIAYLISSTNYNMRHQLHLNQVKLEFANNQLKDQVLRDSLTGLYNNGFVFDYLDQMIEKNRTIEINLTILMIDIDDFKIVNDSFGHLEGDRVIKKVAQVLLAETRDFDIVARYGGEEFMIVLNNSDLEHGKHIAERIRLSIMKADYNFSEKVTVSIGVAQWHKETRMEVIKRADEKLYLAKSAGKNCVC